VSDEVKRFSRPDGKQDVLINRRSDGLFDLGVEMEFEDRECEPLWMPIEYSEQGVFDSMNTAEREAKVRFPWIDKPVEKPE